METKEGKRKACVLCEIYVVSTTVREPVSNSRTSDSFLSKFMGGYN